MARVVGKLEEGIIAFLLAAMTILTFVQVVLRYAFNTGFFWALEATTYMFGWLVLFGMSYGVKVGSHIGVDVLVKLLPAAGQRVIGIIAGALCMLYAGIVLYGGYVYVDKMYLLGVEAEDLPIQRWVLILILPIGFGLLFLRLAQTTWRIVTGKQAGLRLADEAREAIDQLQPEAGAAKGEADRP